MAHRLALVLNVILAELVLIACDTSTSILAAIEPNERSPQAIQTLLGKQWRFTVTPTKTNRSFTTDGIYPRRENTRDLATCGRFEPHFPLPEGIATGGTVGYVSGVSFSVESDSWLANGEGPQYVLSERIDPPLVTDMVLFSDVVIPESAGSYYYFAAGRRKGDQDEGLWVARSASLTVWTAFAKLSDLFPWSLTAALTPGSHHVRLYLETAGQIDTILSKIDTFDDFYDRDVGPIRFLTGDGMRATIAPRDPNVTQSDTGVYAMTWDNRDLRVGPGAEDILISYDKENLHDIVVSDDTYVSDTFGLAFSVDGLNWTVYSNEMTIEGLTGLGVRHVVPVFLTDDQIRLYFTSGYKCTQRRCASPITCSLATALSN